MKQEKMAWINWSADKQQWILRLWDNNLQTYEFSKAWYTKDTTDDGYGFVHDSIICEMAKLQDLGYEVKVTV